MRSNTTRHIALGGMLAATAIVIMCMGGLIPAATYVCPMLCCMTQFVVLRYCGKQLAWVWFIAVSMLSLLFCPDKEAAMVFLAIGYYPLIKREIDKTRIPLLLKLLYFNSSILIVYMVLLHLFGMQQVAEENMELGMIGLIVILFLGNVTFYLLDLLLTIMDRKLR